MNRGGVIRHLLLGELHNRVRREELACCPVTMPCQSHVEVSDKFIVVNIFVSRYILLVFCSILLKVTCIELIFNVLF
jgi:hypothetical protein